MNVVKSILTLFSMSVFFVSFIYFISVWPLCPIVHAGWKQVPQGVT